MTVCTQPVYLQFMRIYSETVHPGNLFLMLFYVTVFKLDNLTAFCANEMIVVFIILHDLKPGAAFSEFLLLCDSELA